MSLTEFIESNYSTACKIQRGIQKDVQMKDMLCEQRVDVVLVKSWMKDYGLFQGVPNAGRDAVIKKYASVVFKITVQVNIQDREQIKGIFHSFLSEFYKSFPRKWLSATSKLLWCSFPDQIAIYDAFVERALVVLQCTKPYLAHFPRIGVCPNINSEADIEKVVHFYMNYQDMVKTIVLQHQDQLTSLRKMHCEEYPHDIRIVDKLLWMIGNPKFFFTRQGIM